MAGYTDLPFRALCRRHGAGLVCTEMVAATSLEHEAPKTVQRSLTRDAERPVSIQIVGSEVEPVARAAARLGEQCDVLGLNLGCPAHQVASAGCGAALLDRPERAVALVQAIKGASPRPLLVKVRAGTQGVMDCAGFARRLEGAGADGLLFHARTAAQSYRGRADWALIRAVKQAVGIPVIGNGDVVDGPGAERALRESGCDGLAIGRAALGDPRIFARVAAHLQGLSAPPLPSPEERLADFRGYLRMAEACGLSLARIVPHAHAFTKGLPSAAALRAVFPRVASPGEALGLFEAHVAGLWPGPASPPAATA